MTTNAWTMSRRNLILAAAGAMAAPCGLAGGSDAARAAAPMLGPSRATHHRFTLGDFEVTTVFDGAVVTEGPHPIFGHDQPPDEVARYAEANLLPADRYENTFTPATPRSTSNAGVGASSSVETSATITCCRYNAPSGTSGSTWTRIWRRPLASGCST